MGARYPVLPARRQSGRGNARRPRSRARRPLRSRHTATSARDSSTNAYPHVTLKSIANNAEIGVIWERWQETLEPLRAEMNAVLARAWEEWEIPREAGEPWPRAPRTPGRR